MQAHYGKTASVWMRQEEVPAYSPLKSNLEADICVVGGGIAGLMTAYLLASEDKSVVVLEKGVLSSGETSRTTAHLSFALDDQYYKLERLFGEHGARLAYESHARAVQLMEDIGVREGMACEFARVDGYLFVSPNQPHEELEREMNAARRAGLRVEWAERAPLPGFDTGRCLRFPHQAQFNPLRFMSGLAEAITRKGGRIFTHTRVDNVSGGARPAVETADGHVVTADAVVVATNSPIHDNLTIHSRQGAYRTYAIGARIPWDAVPRALYWDTLDSYHYVRLKSGHTPKDQSGHDILIVGGEDHRQGDAGDERLHFDWLERWTRERFPIEEVEYRWSGMVLEPADSLGLIGRDNSEQNVFLVTGDSGHGMTHGAIAGMLLSDLIVGRRNEWEELYDPSRLSLQAASEYVSETAHVASEMLDWVTPGEVSNREEIAPGTGAVVRNGLGKHAVYRDQHGAFCESTAVCPHLGCIVSWNSAEESWDCPCHGSRFDPLGKVLRGPASDDLEAVK